MKASSVNNSLEVKLVIITIEVSCDIYTRCQFQFH